ncbi:MAG: MFS transporter [Dehalococcoidia bacterium]
MTDSERAGRGWIPPFAVLAACSLLVFASYGSTQPFLPLFLRELGQSEAGAIAWTGIIQAGMGGALIVVTPFWGAISDRVGQKTMLLRGILGGGISVGLLSLATQAWHVLVLRILVGAAGGVSSTVAALAAAILPPARLAMGMGLIQTFQAIGTSIGPLLGGLGAATIGYRGVFLTSGLFMVMVSGLAAFLIREPPRPARASTEQSSPWQNLSLVLGSARLRAPIAGLFVSQSAYLLGLTLLGLQVQQLGGGGSEGDALVGLVLTANAAGLALGATSFGWLADRLGAEPTALIALLLSALLALPQVWLTDPAIFVAVRAVAGFGVGGILPVLQGQLAREAARDGEMRHHLGAVYGVVQSAMSVSTVVGSALSALIGARFGIAWTHAVAALLFGAAALGYWRLQSARPTTEADR